METKLRKLNPRQELFCQYFIKDEELLGNGTMAYAEAYNFKKEGNWYRSCMVSASRLLRSVKISQRINELLKIYLDDNLVDTELAYVVSQKADLSSKVAAIREYNRLRRRVDESPKVVIPILANVFSNHSDQKNNSDEGESEDSSRRNQRLQNGINNPILDSLGTK